jgi:hypothetical protein
MGCCGTVVSVFIVGAIFAAIGIVALALGASYSSVFCSGVCDAGCRGIFDINSAGDMSCDNCFSLSTSGCTDVRVTNAACSILLRFQVSLITLWPKLIPQSKVTVPIAVDAEIRA